MHAKIECAGRTDIGRKRDSNQDQFLVADLNKSMLVQSTSLNLDAQSRLFGGSHGKLLVVADGMGGHQGGRRASHMAIDLLINQLLNSLHWYFADEENLQRAAEEHFMEDLKRLLHRAHEAIEKEAELERDKKGMGTTFTMAYIVWPWMYVLHAGDSRCYLMRHDEVKQITLDHTVSNQMVEQGGMSADEASRSPWSNVLYNALGAGAEVVEPEVHKVGLQTGDTIVLCSDGLYRYIEDHELADLLATELEPPEACRALIDLANYRGGADNITTIVARVGEVDQKDKNKTRVAAEVTLERLLNDKTHSYPRMPTDDTLDVLPETQDLSTLDGN